MLYCIRELLCLCQNEIEITARKGRGTCWIHPTLIVWSDYAFMGIYLPAFNPVRKTSPSFYVSTVQFFKKKKNIVRRDIARNEQFLLFPQRFLPFWRTFHHFHQI